MTEPAARPRRASVRRPTFIGGWPLVAVTSLAIFLAAFAWMAWRVRAGQDPVLSKLAAKQAQVPAKKIKRIVVVRKVIVTELPPKQVQPAAGSYAAPAASAPSYSPPAYNYSPPAYSPPPAPVSSGS